MTICKDITDPADERHGTYRGYRAHVRAKQPACEPCRQACLTYNAKYSNGGRGNPCLGCGKATRAASRHCQNCQRDKAAPKKPCGICGRRLKLHDGICNSCHIDTCIVPTEADKLTGGRWVTVNGVQRYLSPEDEIAAYALRMSPLLQRLLTERYGNTGDWWTKHGDRFRDEPTQVAQRRREIADEYNAADGRTRDYRREMERVA
ncbi:hypothetical protein [Nocardioides montaniterrae]